MKLKIGDKVYCYRQYYEMDDKNNFANKIVDKVGDIFESIDDYIQDDLLNIDITNRKVEWDNLWNLFKHGIYILSISPMFVISVIILISLRHYIFKKEVIFKKGDYYTILDISKCGDYYVGSDMDSRIFSNNKTNPIRYFFSNRREFAHHFMTGKELRREKLKQLKFK